MFLRRIFKGIPDLGPWLSIAELVAALATVTGVLVGLNVIENPLAKSVPAGTISATVIDAATGQPVPEATVQVMDNTSRVIVDNNLTPDEKGVVKRVVSPGSYTVKAVCDGYCPAEKSVSVAEKSTRIVRLPIKQGREPQVVAGGQPLSQASGRAAPVAAPSAGGDWAAAPRAAAVSGGPRPQAAAPPAPSKASGVDGQLETAKQLYMQGRYQDAKDTCAAALKSDPGDGRVYAKLVLLNLDPACENLADARDWAREGQQKAKKHKGELKKAVMELPAN